MLITKEQLQKVIPLTPLKRIESFIPYLNQYLPKYGIDTKNEVASFLAQILHESGGLKFTREIWGPTKQQLRYERDFDAAWPCKKGDKNWLAFMLGNSEKGDGKFLMGRGLMQITGRGNYRRMSIAMFGDNRLLTTPSLLELPEHAVHSACIFWKQKNIDRFDDDGNVLQETKQVNGGTNGLTERQDYFDKLMEVLTD